MELQAAKMTFRMGTIMETGGMLPILLPAPHQVSVAVAVTVAVVDTSKSKSDELQFLQ
jgi:hypothetical protein